MSNTVIVAESPVTVEVTTSTGVVEVLTATVTTAEVVTTGPQGPPGDAARSYIHTQSASSATWTMAHNLGFKPSVELLNAGSQEIEGDVVHLSQNVCIAYFTTPTAGFARLN